MHGVLFAKADMQQVQLTEPTHLLPPGNITEHH